MVTLVVIVSQVGCHTVPRDYTSDLRESVWPRVSVVTVHDDPTTVETPAKHLMVSVLMVVFAVALLFVLGKGVVAPTGQPPRGQAPR